MTMNKTTFYVLQDALELYMRLGMGQIDELSWFWSTHRWAPSGSGIRGQAKDFSRDMVDGPLNQLRGLVYGIAGPGTSYGIANPSISDVFRVACDAREVLRYQVAWFKEPEGGYTVDFNEPMHHSHDRVPLPDVLVLTRTEKGVKTHQKTLRSSRIRD